MLAGIARQDHPALVGLHQAQELVHLPSTDLSGFIDQYHAASGEDSARQKSTDSLCTTKAVLFKVHDLLPLRGDDRDRAPGLLKSAVHFPQRVTLARAGPAAKQGDKVARPEDSLGSLALLGVQSGILDRMAGAVRTKPANAVFGHAHNLPFPSQQFLRCDLPGVLFIAQIATLAGRGLNIGQADALPAHMLQRVPPQFVLTHH